MFDPATPRVFALPPGVDFPAHLVAGLHERMADKPPEAMARVTLFLNTARMRRRVTELFVARGSGFLPRLRLITDLAEDPLLNLPPPISPLRRRLELGTLIGALLQADPDLAPQSARFDLSDSLADLMAEMHGEGISPDALARLDVSGHAKHWEKSQAFLRIITPLFVDAGDVDSRQRLAVSRLAAAWSEAPPRDPILVAGSTGSRGTTALFMQLIARLPHGALILPGVDPDLPASVWAAMDDALTAEDHPQYRFRRLMDALGIGSADLRPWRPAQAPSPSRNKLISLSLRPAPVTDQWLFDGPKLPDLIEATRDLTLIEAPTPRIEALSIALILRDAAERGITAALITPDRNLSRQVTAALDRWAIIPDDSAGKPLAHSAPGRLLRQIAELFGKRLSADRLLSLLKHPLTASGGDRGTHLRFTRDLELTLRKKGPAFPERAHLEEWARARNDPAALPWVGFVWAATGDTAALGRRPLSDWVKGHRTLAETLARGLATEGAGGLWEKEAGAAAAALLEELCTEAPFGGDFSAAEYRDLFESLVAKGEVRESVQSRPNIMIWGTLEARVQGADLVILGGLNDGIWPKAPAPDPWLNRQMRKTAGLLLPERQIGLSAHDYQQAIAAPQVVLSRATRDAEAETVPSRWLNRLLGLMRGLPQINGGIALKAMQDRGTHWIGLAHALERPTAEMLADPRLQPAKRPAPKPPVAARPNRLSLTRIEGLIRDPYAIYARHVLGLRRLDPLHQSADARDRGIAIHEILEQFARTRPEAETRSEARDRLLAIARDILVEQVPFPAARALWLAKLDRAADHFLTHDTKHKGRTLAVETVGEQQLDGLDFKLFGIPDRIDRLPDGRLLLIDYKTGAPPSVPQQRTYAKQLLLAAAIAERGGFRALGPSEVGRISYVGLGSAAKAVETPMTAAILDVEWAKLCTLISRYLNRATGFAARRAVFESRFPGDYDHLARFGEWQMSDAAVAEFVGPEDPS